MKKHIIAAAVAGAVAAPAMAQNIQIYGVLDQSYASTSTEVKGTANTKDSLRTTGAASVLQSQRLGFRGTEDLGGGLKASFNLELAIGAQDAEGDSGRDNAFGAAGTRQQNLGISGSFGSLRFGRMTTLADTVWAVGSTGMQNNAVGTIYANSDSSSATNTGANPSLGSGTSVNSSTMLATRLSSARSDRLIEYVSPNFNGLTVAVQYGQRVNDKESGAGIAAGYTSATALATDGKVSHKETGLRVAYEKGPLSVALGYMKEEQEANDTTANVERKLTPTTTVLGANYDFGVAKAFFTYANSTNTETVETNKTKYNVDGYEVGVHVPVSGALRLLASYGKATADSKLNAAAKTNYDWTVYQLGGLYSMSKRTTLYALYGSLDYDVNKTDTGDRKVTQYAVGLRHTF